MVKKTKTKEEESISILDILNVTEKRAEVIAKKIHSDNNVVDTIKFIQNLEHQGEMIYAAYAFGRDYEKWDSRHEAVKRLAKILGCCKE